MDTITTAKIFATAAHAAISHKRKYTMEDYIVHPTEVAEIVATVTDDAEMIAAAYLHDVLEDTSVTRSQLAAIVGDAVTDLVVELTDVSKRADGNRAIRKEIDRSHTATASGRAKTIKLADLISNSVCILKHDENFAKTYFAEKEKLLEVLKEGDATLYARASAIVAAYRASKVG